MDAELITTGTEILLGEIVDTNAAWLARRLRDLGVNLYYKTTVGDNLDRITAIMRQALARSDLVLVTGGLGPTADDVTRQAAAQATNRKLTVHQESLAAIEAIFARWGRTTGENNRRQALLPADARPVPNPVGTAPGFIVEVARTDRPPALLICLPGVPREMKHLMQETVEPLLVERLGVDRVVIKARVLRTVGIGESTIDNHIADLMQSGNPTVGLAAHLGQVDVRITARAASETEADELLAGVATEIQARLGRYIYGEGDETLETALIRALQAAGYELAVLETNTGSEIAQRLASVPGGEHILRRTMTASSTAELAPDAPAELVSQAAADWAARWLLHQSGQAGLALALCGTLAETAGPYPRADAERGETFMALATGDRLHHWRFGVGGSSEIARRWVGNWALDRLRRWLQDERTAAEG